MTKLSDHANGFARGAKEGAKEAMQDLKDGYDVNQPEKFKKYHWGQLKGILVFVGLLFAYIIFGAVQRGW